LRFAILAFAAVTLLAVLAGSAYAGSREPPSHQILPKPKPVLTLRADGGGYLEDYETWVAKLAAAGSRIRIDGVCASACTMLLRLPRERLCVTPRASLWFHQGWLNGERSEEGTWQLMRAYPFDIRAELWRRGGLTARWIKLKAADLRRFLRPCA
jgi:hypothetical protein